MINTDLIKQGKAVKCNTWEEKKELFRAMGWKMKPEPVCWSYFWESPSLEDGWDASAPTPLTLDVVDFSELEVKQSGLAKALGVDDGEYFKFMDWEEIFCVENGELVSNLFSHGISGSRMSAMINNPDKIKKVTPWSSKVIEAARMAEKYGYVILNRSKNGDTLFNDQLGDWVEFHGSDFEELEDGMYELCKLI